MALRAVVFDLFHTLTGPEAEWSDVPWTSDVLGIDRRVWNELLVTRSRWRLTGEETNPYVSLGLISNADVMEVAAWPASPLAGLFDVEVFSCMAGCAKPERTIYDRCLRALGVSPAESLFVGDGGSDELVGAREAGMSTVFVSGVMASLWPERVSERRASADYHIERVPELLALLGLTPHAADGAADIGSSAADA